MLQKVENQLVYPTFLGVDFNLFAIETLHFNFDEDEHKSVDEESKSNQSINDTNAKAKAKAKKAKGNSSFMIEIRKRAKFTKYVYSARSRELSVIAYEVDKAINAEEEDNKSNYFWRGYSKDEQFGLYINKRRDGLSVVAIDDNARKVSKLNEFKFKFEANCNGSGKIGECIWIEGNRFLMYDDKHLFVFQNAANDALKQARLLKVFNGVHSLAQTVIDMIGFELYGCWLCSNQPLFVEQEFGRHKRKIGRYISLQICKARTDSNKQSAVISKGISSIVIDLDPKYMLKKTPILQL